MIQPNLNVALLPLYTAIRQGVEFIRASNANRKSV